VTYSKKLRDAIEKMHGARPTHRERSPSKRSFKVRRCGKACGGIRPPRPSKPIQPMPGRMRRRSREANRHVAVLHIPPAISPVPPSRLHRSGVPQCRINRSSRSLNRALLDGQAARTRQVHIVPVRFSAEDRRKVEAAARPVNRACPNGLEVP